MITAITASDKGNECDDNGDFNDDGDGDDDDGDNDTLEPTWV